MHVGTFKLFRSGRPMRVHPSNGDSGESHRSWECARTRLWSMFVKTHACVYLWWSRGPSRHTHSTQTWHAFFIGWGSCASAATAHTFLDVSHHLFDPGGQSSLRTDLITWSHHHETEFNNKTTYLPEPLHNALSRLQKTCQNLWRSGKKYLP